MGRKIGLKGEIIKVTHGVLGTLTDFVLGYIFFVWEASLGGVRTIGQACRAIDRAHEDLEFLNYKRIRRAVEYLAERGFLEFVKDELVIKPIVTQKGRKRLVETFPTYDEDRVWDGKAYFIFYDVPEAKRKERDTLREFLKGIDCGQVQASVWVTFYNPIKLLAGFQKKIKISGSIIVSCLGRGGYIRGETLKEFAARVFKLEKLNERYQEFIEKYKGKKVEKKLRLAFDFLAILRDDPQLPFELLPDEWVGDQAYELFKKVVGKGTWAVDLKSR